MCGVTAIYAFHPSAPPADRDELLRIRDSMTLRGPDAKGEWFSKDARLAIGHRRLSIIDLSERATQPMCNADQSVVLSFNGEIYNYLELRRDLENAGQRFATRSDTEVVLRLYELEGDAMLHDLRGMFAMIIWDQRKQTLTLARDAYGIKPLYYANDGWTIRVASQVKALMAGGRVSRRPDPAGSAGFLLFGSVPEPYTSFQEIRAVPAGSIVQVGPHGLSEPRVWQSIPRLYSQARRENPVAADATEAERIARDALLDSVKHHLVSDVPVGMFLSSGIDSNAVLGLARDAGATSLDTTTLAFAEFAGGANDESQIAERSAKTHGSKHRTQLVSEAEFRTQLPTILAAMDQPSIDGINTWLVSKAAAEAGLKVCLSGLGGDELFGGYPSFGDIPRWVRRMRVAGRLPLLGSLWRFGFRISGLQALGLSPKTAGFVSYAGSYPGAYLLRRGLFMPWELPELLGAEMAREGLRRLRVSEHIGSCIEPDPGSAFARVACLESCMYLRNQLLRDADWAGMAHSLEIRLPLVDTTLLAAIAPLVYCRGFEMSKALLASAPSTACGNEIVQRGKTGFMVPIDSWMQNLRDTLDSWRRVPTLARSGCHWARRLAYSIAEQATV